ncbi:MAG: LapA family protein [Fidelibacterota bacterium]|nr:MAG: LapA family protein [Candidatus Neomarinimicrobiota bacterium]
MRLVKILLGLLIVLALAFFLSKNSGQYVTIWLLPGMELPDINLAHVLVITLAAGILLGFAIGLVQIITQHAEVRQQNRQLKKLRTELNNLRHSALSEEFFESEHEVLPDTEPATASPEESPSQLE